MPNLTDFDVLTFDVYGTLVDWETGIMAALEPLLSRVAAKNPGATQPSRKEILELLGELEKAQEAETPDMPYAELLATIYPRLAARLLGSEGDEAEKGKEEVEEEAKTFGASVSTWPPFPDTVSALRRLATHFRLVVLSNVDGASFAATNAGPLQGIPFDLVLTAQEIGSYKPDPRNFAYMLEKVKEKFGVEKGGVIQTAQSQWHDHRPAQAMGMKTAWIARRGAVMGNVPVGEEVYDWRFETLGEMADALEREVEGGLGRGKGRARGQE